MFYEEWLRCPVTRLNWDCARGGFRSSLGQTRKVGHAAGWPCGKSISSGCRQRSGRRWKGSSGVCVDRRTARVHPIPEDFTKDGKTDGGKRKSFRENLWIECEADWNTQAGMEKNRRRHGAAFRTLIAQKLLIDWADPG